MTRLPRSTALALLLALVSTPTEAGKPSSQPYESNHPGLVSRSRPDYPDLARRAGIEGQVVLAARLEEDGTVSDACVLATFRRE